MKKSLFLPAIMTLASLASAAPTIDGNRVATEGYLTASNSAAGVDTNVNFGFGDAAKAESLKATNDSGFLYVHVEGSLHSSNRTIILIDSDNSNATGWTGGTVSGGTYGENTALGEFTGIGGGGYDLAIGIQTDGNNPAQQIVTTILSYNAAGAKLDEIFDAGGSGLADSFTQTVRSVSGTMSASLLPGDGANAGIELKIPVGWLLTPGAVTGKYRVAAVNNNGSDYWADSSIPQMSVAGNPGNPGANSIATLASQTAPQFIWHGGYAATGAGTSLIGTGGDYASLAAASAALSGTTNNNTVTNKALTANVATLTFGAASTFAVNQSITVSTGDPVFDGTFTVVSSSGSTVTYARSNANVASTATTGVVYTTSGAGTRDASAWTFLILNDLTETINSEIRCTVTGLGSVTFRPAPGIRPTITWPNTIAANFQSSGHITIGATNGGTTIGYTSTNNIIFDGSNTVGGKTRDMVLVDATGDTESGLFLRIRGNNDGIQFRNFILMQNSALASAQAITFTSDLSSPDVNKCPDNWVVDNCMINAQASTSGEAIRSSNSGAITAGQAQTGYSITNNLALAGTRGLYLNQNGGGTISGNTIRLASAPGLLGWAIYHSTTNSATGIVMNITGNNIDLVNSPNANAGDFGIGAILVSPANVASTYNINNNMIGGWAFTGAAADADYLGISVRGSATGAATAVVNIEHNSINMPSTASVTGATIARAHAIARTATTTPPTLNIKNNIIRYLQGGTNAYAIYTAATGNISYDGNDIVIGGSSAGFASIGGVTATNYAAYQGLDAHAQNVDPTTTTGGAWLSASANNIADLHFTAAPTTLNGTSVATTLSTDFDGETRAIGGTALPGADVTGAASTSYTWNVNGAGYFNAASNWTPTRTTPRFNDVLVIDGAVTAGNVVIQDLRDSHIGGLSVTNNASATLQYLGGIGGNRLVVYNGNGTAAADFTVGAGSTLRLAGNGGVTIDLDGGAVGTVSGDVVFAATSNAIVHRILSKTASGLTFASGSSAAMAPTGSGALGGFGASTADSAANSVVFQSGSTYYQGGLKNGTRNGGTGSNPFALTAPASVVVFNSGSTYVTWDSLPSISGRTYGNFICKNFAAQTALGGGSAWVVQNDLTFAPSGGASSGSFGMTAQTGAITIGGNLTVQTGAGVFNALSAPGSATNWSIGGNVDIQDVALFTPPTSSNVTVALNGTSSQSVNFAGAALPNVNLNNTAGATLASPLTVSGTLSLTAGELVTGANALTVANATRAAGQVTGTLTRTVDATVTGARLFPVGTAGKYAPATIDITGAGTGTGTIAVASNDGLAASLPSGVGASNALARNWDVTATGITGATSTVSFGYLAGDVNGDESDYQIAEYSGSGTNWTQFASTAVNTGTHSASATGITSFNKFTLFQFNSPATDITLTPATIAEDQTSGTTVGTLASVDGDSSNFTYQLIAGTGDDDNASFTIVGNALKTAIALDFEAKPSYTVRVQTTDDGAPTASFAKALTITISDVNEAPTDLALTNSAISESLSAQTVGTLSSTDPDAGSVSYAYALVSGSGSTDNALFSISGNTLSTSGAISSGNYSVRIQTTDSGSLSFAKAFAITVTAVGDVDLDGVDNSIEAGAPNSGDGNSDFIQDSQQATVASLPAGAGSVYMTIVTSAGTLASVSTTGTIPSGAPANTTFPYGLGNFTINGVTNGGTVTVTLIIPTAVAPLNKLYKYQDSAFTEVASPTIDVNTITGKTTITYTLTDGGAGDADTTANGVIVDPIAPAVFDSAVSDWTMITE